MDHLENAGTGKLTATAGEAFTERISTRAETDGGKAVAKVRIRFTVLGDTDTTFIGGESVATVLTNSSGVAVAPVLRAGEKTGNVTVRATVVGRVVPGLDYRATVTERVADTVVRTDDEALTCTPGGEFAHRLEVLATHDGAAAGKVAATATLITSADDPTVNDKGPYFKDADDKAVRTLNDLRTDADGRLKLPQLYADDTTGTFLLRITTAGGATLTVELTVAEAGTASPNPPGARSRTRPRGHIGAPLRCRRRGASRVRDVFLSGSPVRPSARPSPRCRTRQDATSRQSTWDHGTVDPVGAEHTRVLVTTSYPPRGFPGPGVLLLGPAPRPEPRGRRSAAGRSGPAPAAERERVTARAARWCAGSARPQRGPRATDAGDNGRAARPVRPCSRPSRRRRGRR